MAKSMIPLTNPVLVKPLLPDEQEALKHHGCSLEPFPRGRPAILKGYRMTFPRGTEMEDIDGYHYTMYFPDGYHPTLVWKGDWYHFYPERSLEGGYLL